MNCFLRSVSQLAMILWVFPGLASQSGPLVFTNATVIDGTGAPAQTGMTLVVHRGRIEALGKSDRIAVPQKAEVVNAKGKFMIPGLWDMHVHLSDARPSSL